MCNFMKLSKIESKTIKKLILQPASLFIRITNSKKVNIEFKDIIDLGKYYCYADKFCLYRLSSLIYLDENKCNVASRITSSKWLLNDAHEIKAFEKKLKTLRY